MSWLSDPGYWFSRLVFTRALAIVYLVAYLSAALQFRALLGSRGLTPIPRYASGRTFRRCPSIFVLHYSDRFFAAIAWSGVAVSLALLAGVGDLLPLWAYPLPWLALWACYVSIVNVGQTWYSFGWESLLCEIGFLAAFLGPSDVAPPILVLFLIRWLLFRVEFGAGLIKMRGDKCWRDLTCLYYHHETQPMPGPLSWFFHHLPKPLHRVEVAANHVAQLVVPWLLFTPQPVAGVAAAIIIVTQCWLVASGNFAWLNLITITLALAALDGRWLDAILSVDPPAHQANPLLWDVATIALTLGIAILSWWPVRNLLSRRQLMNYSFNKLHLVNTYGAFGSVGRVRHEIIVEGSYDGNDWHEYGFRGKPGDPRHWPRQFAPYHLRLDWLMWFAAISPRYAEPWFRRFVQRLLEGHQQTLKLLRHNPFHDQPPTLVRARLFRYRYTTWAELRRTRACWERTYVREFLPPTGNSSRKEIVE